MNKSTLLILSASCLFWLGTATAQDSPYSISTTVAGVNTAVTIYTGAPAGFDPAAASVEELEAYGYPRRPEQSDERAYKAWSRAVATERITPTFVANPKRFHRPNQKVSTGSTVKNTTNLLSGNWSGYALVGGSPTFDEVYGDWIVPNVNSQSNTSITGYSSMWVGIDGDCNCNDLVQDGTAQDFAKGKTSYYAWIEFIPEPEVEISNFTVQPGDFIEAYSTVATKSGVVYGEYYIANLNTKKSFSASLKIPANTKFSGLSAEWIVERTEVNGSFQNPMPNYAYAYMDDAWAYRKGSSSKVTYLSEANQNITMVDSNNTKLSKAYEQDSDSMWFEWLAY